MVIGNGMIATRFAPYQHEDGFLIYASGVSNSNCFDQKAFNREYDLLRQYALRHPDKILVYFSTCSILDDEQKGIPYVQHKISMENWIQGNVKKFVIFRISNPIGNTNNTHTFFNFFLNQIIKKHPFDIWRFASRNILDIDDMYKICDYILKHEFFMNQIVNVANITNYSVLDIVEAIEKHYQIKGIYNIVNRGNGPLIPTIEIHPIISQLQIDFSHNYIERILNKYF